MSANSSALASAKPIFGFQPSALEAAELCARVGGTVPRGGGPRLIVTPNLDHVVQLSRNANFRAAYCRAKLILCDGFPVHYYARLRGHRVRRVTGCEIATHLLAPGAINPEHRLLFIVDHAQTASAVNQWAAERGIESRVAAIVPRLGFVHDPDTCRRLALAARENGTTLLIMGVGAPQSEIFVDRYREVLPDCWALCVGQAVKIALGLVRRAPLVMQRLHMEWLWRLMQEPRRLGRRYATGAFLFVAAVADDLLRRRS